MLMLLLLLLLLPFAVLPLELLLLLMYLLRATATFLDDLAVRIQLLGIRRRLILRILDLLRSPPLLLAGYQTRLLFYAVDLRDSIFAVGQIVGKYRLLVLYRLLLLLLELGVGEHDVRFVQMWDCTVQVIAEFFQCRVVWHLVGSPR